jgi:uncharacterized cupredoxin-like copper-binding protein
MKKRSRIVLPLVALLVLLGSSCSNDDGGGTGGGTGGASTGGSSTGGGGGVGVTLADYSVTLDSTSLTAGEVTFDVTNDAGQVHEFVVVQTDLAEDALPTDDAGDVDEESPKIAPVDEIEDIEPGTQPSLSVTLEAGSYVALCNLPGHYRQGMHTAFEVA